MKIKRYKKAERYMSLYKNNFGFREPYQILLDGTFCQVALAHKVNIQDQLPKYIGGQCKLLTTACVIEEARKLGKPLHGAYLILSQFPIHNCNHEQPISASKCLSSFVIDSRNSSHYLIATQDHNLRLKVAKQTVCPLIKLANNALVMEKPTAKVQDRVVRRNHFIANKIDEEEIANLVKMKEDAKLIPKPGSGDEEIVKKKKKRSMKGANPLSCKKKKRKDIKKPDKSKPDDDKEANKSTSKRRKKKVFISRHVKNFLKESLTAKTNPTQEVKPTSESKASNASEAD